MTKDMCIPGAPCVTYRQLSFSKSPISPEVLSAYVAFKETLVTLVSFRNCPRLSCVFTPRAWSISFLSLVPKEPLFRWECCDLEEIACSTPGPQLPSLHPGWVKLRRLRLKLSNTWRVSWSARQPPGMHLSVLRTIDKHESELVTLKRDSCDSAG